MRARGRRRDRLPRRVHRARVRSLAVASVGLALVAAACITRSADFSAAPAFETVVPQTPQADAPHPSEAALRTEATRPTAARSPAVATRSARLTDVGQATPEPEPARLALPRLGIDIPVTPVGVLTDTGEMEVPDDVGLAGWYRYGAAPGAAEGSAVLAAHVDDRRQGLGAFAALRDAREGDDVAVTRADGTVVGYTVTALQQVPKQDLPTALFERTGPHRLVLVTCGGDFDTARRTYRDNVIVVAEPSSEPVP